MSKFFATILTWIFLSALLYIMTATIVAGRLMPPVISYTNSTSLNHSLHRLNRHADAYIVGSSIALRNVDAEMLTSELDKEFQVLAGLGMKPLETLQLLSKTDLQEKTVIIPLCIEEINKLSVSPNLTWDSFRIKNFADFRRDRVIYSIPENQVGHVRFNRFGNAFFPSCEDGMVMPFKRHGKVVEPFKIDLAYYIKYFDELRRVQAKQRLELHIVLMPYSTNYGSIIQSKIPMMDQLFNECNNDSLTLHDFCYDEPDFEKFIDLIHMSNVGARDFTHILARHLANDKSASGSVKEQKH